MKLLMEIIKRLSLPSEWKARIACFFQAKFTISSIVVIFNKKKEVLLFYHTYREKPWGLPGGFLKSGEHPTASIIREVFEESGYKITKLKQFSILVDKSIRRLIVCYITNNCEGIFKPSKEVSEAKYFSLDKLPILPSRQVKTIMDSLKILVKN
ncbi:MAG: NUDIX hydrolase [uncultured bacterium]|nr:MAG: NUDIX hydrolase [uncultured bacterium]